MKYRVLLLSMVIFYVQLLNAQVVTKEDSLYSGILQSRPGESTFISGYGEAVYRRDIKLDTSYLNIPRVVTFFGHRFSKNILFFSALEFRDIKVSGGAPGGEVSFEQAFVKFNVDSLRYFQTGLFLPRIGFLNENHLPANYHSNERPLVETILLPGVWREMGVGFYGGSKIIKGFYYNLALINGLNYKKLGENGTGIREATINGPRSANNLAVTGALLYFIEEVFRLQTSFYYGGTVGLRRQTADTLGLVAGPFGTPALINEANVQFRKNGWDLRLLGARVYIPEVAAINKANDEEHPIAKTMVGGYVELAYNVFYTLNTKKALIFFSRLEAFDLNYTPAAKQQKNGLLKQTNFIAGINYAPLPGVVLKLDYKFSASGSPPSDIILPTPFYTHKNYVSLGFGYSF